MPYKNDPAPIHIPEKLFRRVMLEHRRDISGPDRKLLVMQVRQDRTLAVHIQDITADLDELSSPENRFGNDLRRVWMNYAVGQAAMIIVVGPGPFTGIMVHPLPWSEVKAEELCPRCGAYLGTGNQHVC